MTSTPGPREHLGAAATPSATTAQLIETCGSTGGWRWYRHHTLDLVVEEGGRPVATVIASTGKRPVSTNLEGPSRHATARNPAWPPASADRAASMRRWNRQPETLWLVSLVLDNPHDQNLARRAVDAVCCALAASGTTRVDVRLHEAASLGAVLEEAGWFWGHTPEGELWSTLLGVSVRQPAPPTVSRLPRVLARTLRRLRVTLPAELVMVGVEEVGWALRRRRWPRIGQPQPSPTAMSLDATASVSSRYRTIRQALTLVPDGLRAGRFLDVGCGDGKVLHEAARSGFAAVTGWDLDPNCVESARQAHRGVTAEVADARITQMPGDVSVVYLFNPFGPDSLRCFADRLAASLRVQPRPLLVVYNNAPTLRPLLDIGLVVVHATPTLTVLATTA